IFLFFFFFQAEDGIRDFHVTGVQTCALPIFSPRPVPTGDDTLASKLLLTTTNKLLPFLKHLVLTVTGSRLSYKPCLIAFSYRGNRISAGTMLFSQSAAISSSYFSISPNLTLSISL